MKKCKICKILLVILAIFLCVAFYELLGICVAYKKQPEVSNTTKKETKNGSWQFFYVWLFMNCSESALHIKSSRKCPIQPKKKQKMGHGTNAVKIQNGQ